MTLPEVVDFTVVMASSDRVLKRTFHATVTWADGTSSEGTGWNAQDAVIAAIEARRRQG